MFGQELAFAIGEIDGEKISGSGYVRSAISHWVYLVERWADTALAQPTGFGETHRRNGVYG